MSRRPQSARRAAILPESSRPRLQPWLERAGYAICPPETPDLVFVVDWTVPGGREEQTAIRQRFGRRPAIFCIVGEGREDAEEPLRLGADAFIAASRIEAELDLRLERVRKFNEVQEQQQQRERNLATLLELSGDYASALDVAGLLHDVTRRLADELFIDRCALVLLDEERGTGHIVAASDDRDVHNLVIDLSRYPEIREAVRTGEPVVVDDVEHHPLLGEVKEAVARRGIAALAAVPLTVHKKTFGVLLLRASQGSFDAHEVNFAWTVAHATAIALRNARMLEGLRGQAAKAEAQLAELARYEEFFQYVSEGIALLDEQGALLSLNPAGAQILGVDPEKARGKMFVLFATPLCASTVLETLHAVRQGLVCRNVDLDIDTGDGSARTISVCGSTIPGNTGLILSFRDVSEARAMERELRKTKEFLEKLINASADGIVAADAAGTVVLYNESAERVLGRARAEVLGKMHVRALYPAAVAERVMAIFAGSGGADPVEPTRADVLGKGGERVPVLMSVAAIREGEQAVASVAVFTDLRERTRLEAKLNRAQERLQEAEKQAVIVELAGTAAHELNQPLTSVMGYAELLKRRLKEEDPAWRPVDIIYREAERMAEIVRKIGKITRYETKAYVGNSRIVDLDRAAGDEE